MKKPVILVTGCRSGLRLAMVKLLAQKDHHRIVATARKASLDRLKEEISESENLICRELDVMDYLQAGTLVNEVCEKWGGVDVLVNNAGICFRGVVEHMDTESEMIQLQTNYLGPMNLIRAVLPIMREQKSGQIINISSVSGMVSMPTMGSYSASKHALEGATEALWYEARPFGIKVSLVEPGFINSEAFSHVVLSKKAQLSLKLKGPHSEYYGSMAPFVERLMHWSFATPESIAKKVEKLIHMEDPPLRKRVTIDAIVFAILRRVLPANLFHKMMFSLLPGSSKWGCRKFRFLRRLKYQV